MNSSGLTKKKSVFVFIVYIIIFIAGFAVRTKAFYLDENGFHIELDVWGIPLGAVLNLQAYCSDVPGSIGCYDDQATCEAATCDSACDANPYECSGCCCVDYSECGSGACCSDSCHYDSSGVDCNYGSWGCSDECTRQRDVYECTGSSADCPETPTDTDTGICPVGTYCSAGSCVSGSEGSAYENCDDNLDNDCDSSIDCDDPGCADSDYCSPHMTSFSFSTSLEQINVNWITESGAGGTVDVECTFNSVQNCEPFPYSSAPGGGSCTITAPQYDMTPAAGETRTVPNTLYCKAYDHDNPSLYSETTRTIYPLSFEVSTPLAFGPVVGEEQNLVLTVKNNGTFIDSYTISIVSANPQLLIIENGEQSTQLLGTNDAQQIYVGVTLLSAEESVNANIVVSSNTSRDYTEIKYEQTAVIRGSDKILPDFSIFGIFQIMLIAAALVSFLF